MPRIEKLATISESEGALTRRFATAQHRAANDTVANWMRDAGMSVHEDDIGNIIGRYEGLTENAPAVMLGSHLDTVINAGRFDGMLGVLSAIAVVDSLNASNCRLPFAVEVVGFADEEGVRYQSTFLGSRVMAGTFESELLNREDKHGISMREALLQFGKNPEQLDDAARGTGDLLAYIELHIEQGPVLEQQALPVGVVTSISGATRLNVQLSGLAGHAGTVPMPLRQDALAGAAAVISLIETRCTNGSDLVGTVGRIDAQPGAGNVIPGSTEFTVDIRAASDEERGAAVSDVLDGITAIAKERRLEVSIEKVHEEGSVHCDAQLTTQIKSAIDETGIEVAAIGSGAGHDAAAMATITPVAMIFVRCAGGVSHNPAESVTEADAIVGADVLLRSVLHIASG